MIEPDQSPEPPSNRGKDPDKPSPPAEDQKEPGQEGGGEVCSPPARQLRWGLTWPSLHS